MGDPKLLEKKRHWVRNLVMLMFISIPLLLVCVAVSISDEESMIVGRHRMDTDTASNTKALAMEIRSLLKSQEEKVQIRISQEEMNSLVALVSRAAPRITGHFNVTQQGLRGTFSLHIPENIFGEYVNVQFGVLPSATGLNFTEVSIGNITLPGNSLFVLARYLTNLVFRDQTGDIIFGSVQSVETINDEILVSFRPIPDIKDRLRRLGDIRDEMAVLGDLKIIRQYYAKLCETDNYYPHDVPISAMAYVAPIFAYAKSHSFDSESAVKANQAAMLALGIYLGSDRFEVLVGDLQSQTNEKCRRGTPNVVFRDRHDLVQHFFISSTMKILSNSNMSFAVGEYKELIDTTTGGLSVSDIAGNIAGIRFAELVLNPDLGLSAQQIISESISERVIFPDIQGMPPKLKREQFEKKYGNVEDPRYQAMLADIEGRIDRLPIYVQSRREGAGGY